MLVGAGEGTGRAPATSKTRDAEDPRPRRRRTCSCDDERHCRHSEGHVHPPRQRRRVRPPSPRDGCRPAQSPRAGAHGCARAGAAAAATTSRERVHGLHPEHAHDRARRPSPRAPLVQRGARFVATPARGVGEEWTAFRRPRLSWPAEEPGCGYSCEAVGPARIGRVGSTRAAVGEGDTPRANRAAPPPRTGSHAR